nr:aminotransferase class V-fold PLP-dependent enzyme [Ignavibacteria bacterium]
GIVGFGKACEIAMTDMAADQARIKGLRDRLYSGLTAGIENIKLNGHPEKRINGNLNISIKNIDADSLMISIKDIAVSTGSACSSESVEPSHVLTAIGIDNKLKRSTIRFGIGKFNTAEEIDYAVAKITEKVKYLFSILPDVKRNRKGDHASV